MIVFPAMRPGPALKVSATTYSAFLRCPAQAQARFDERAYPEESKDSFRGALVHRLIARHLRNGPIEDVEAAARAEIGEALNEKMVALGINRPSLLAPVMAEAVDLYRRFSRFPIEGFQSAEVGVEHCLEGEVRLVGKIDGVFSDGAAPILRDWKTGPLGEPFVQLWFYALIWLLSRGELPSVEAVSLQTGEKARQEPSIDDLQSVTEGLAALVNAIRSVWAGESSAGKTAGPWCWRCPVLVTCAEGQAASVKLGDRYRADE